MQIRKCETYQSWQTTEVANLDPEKFRNLSVPFEGESEKDFLIYIGDNRYELEEIWDEIDKDTRNELAKLYEPNWKEYFNSTWKFEDSWYESGREDESFTKTGGFEVNESTGDEW